MTQPDQLKTELGNQLSAARALYLDLVIRAVSNTIYEDPDASPWGTGGFDARRRVCGRDWPAVAHTMIGIERLQNLRTLTEAALVHGVPGDFIETGVWRGGACILMRAVLAAYGDRHRRDSRSGRRRSRAARQAQLAVAVRNLQLGKAGFVHQRGQAAQFFFIYLEIFHAS